jgi:repressor LexA
MDSLTKRQNDILNFIKEYIVARGYPPTVREIGEALGLSSPATIHSHLNNLENKGYIRRNNYKNRAIELLVKNEYQNNDPSVVDVPLLGMVTAGSPIEAIETPDEYFSIPVHMIPTKKEVFTLKVSGDSMINAGIYDGDIAIIQRQNTANNGDIVVAMNNENEVTLKRFYKERNYFRLQPENDKLDPIIVDNVTILGKPIGLFRKF